MLAEAVTGGDGQPGGLAVSELVESGPYFRLGPPKYLRSTALAVEPDTKIDLTDPAIAGFVSVDSPFTMASTPGRPRAGRLPDHFPSR